MFNQILAFLLQTFLGLFVLALLLRFWLQALRAPLRNPMYTFFAALTDWIVVPARRVIPGLWRTDLSTLVLAWLAQVLLLLALRALGAGEGTGAGLVQMLVLATFALVRLSLYILMFSVIAVVVLSWVAPHSPAAPILNSLTRPFLQPFRRRIPPIGNVDLSPLFLLVAIQIGLFLLLWVEGGIVRGIPG
jgi:YggT family protein